MKAIFIAGTDTGVGKSVVTGLFAGYLASRGYRVVTQKWVETGALNGPTDIDVHLEFMADQLLDDKRDCFVLARARSRNDESNPRAESFSIYRRFMEPYVFALAASPHLAAFAEKKRIKFSEIKRAFRKLAAEFDRVIVEGSGGLLVPLDKKRLVIDIVAGMDLPVLLVAANKLGAINTTLLSIEALKARRMKIAGVLFNNIVKNEDKLILEDNPSIVKALSGVRVFGPLPYSKDRGILRRVFRPIGKRIGKRLW